MKCVPLSNNSVVTITLEESVHTNTLLNIRFGCRLQFSWLNGSLTRDENNNGNIKSNNEKAQREHFLPLRQARSWLEGWQDAMGRAAGVFFDCGVNRRSENVKQKLEYIIL